MTCEKLAIDLSNKETYESLTARTDNPWSIDLAQESEDTRSQITGIGIEEEEYQE